MKILLMIVIVCSANNAATLPNPTFGHEEGGSANLLETRDFDIDDFKSVPLGAISDVSIGLQHLFSSFTKNVKKIHAKMADLERKANDLLDRLTLLDCYDLKLQDPLRHSGIYKLYLDHIGKRPVSVYCDMITDGGGWTVIQQRLAREFNTTNVNFDRPFHEYQVGFGVPESDYWIGLENLHVWTNSRPYELRIHLEDFDENVGHALYNSFHVDNENKGYKLHLGDYSGDVGDSLGSNSTRDNYTAHGMMFSTGDMDQDTSFEINCSKFWNIGGWWFNRCSWANLNGPYLFPGEGRGIGINWHKWRNNKYMKSTKMMIRPITH